MNLKNFTFKSRFFPILICLLTNWTRSISAYMVGLNPYHRMETLDSQGKFRVEWKVDRDLEKITFHVTVETKGYVGFGIAIDGVLSGADFILGGVHPNGDTYFSDYHTIRGSRTLIVDRQQDWVLQNAKENTTHTFLSFSRKFDTCDPNDLPIDGNRLGLIWAFGDRDKFDYHHQNRGDYDVYLLNPDYTPEMTSDPKTGLVHVNQRQYPNAKVWTINSRTEMPRHHTTYWCSVYQAPTLQRKHHIIGYRVTLPNEISRRHVHHIMLYKCVAPQGLSARELFGRLPNGSGQSCMGIANSRGIFEGRYCSHLVLAWAIGGKEMFTPPHVGIPFGENREEFYVIQTHFDNPYMTSGVNVDVTLDFVYTDKLRANDGGTVLMGHDVPGFPSSLLIPPSSRDHVIHGICGGGCTQRIFPPEGIKIIGQVLHTHSAGKTVRFQHFRNNQELPWIASDDNYDNEFQQFQILHNDVHVQPGDTLVSRCSYDNTKANGSTVGGFATTQEMCLSIFMYYTKMDGFDFCGSHIDSHAILNETLGVSNATWSDADAEFIVHEPKQLEGLRVSQVSDNHVNWTLEKRQQLERFHQLHPHTNVCGQATQSNGLVNNGGQSDTFSTTTGYPLHAKPYQPPNRVCKRRRVSNKGWQSTRYFNE